MCGFDASGDSVPRAWPSRSAEQVQRDQLRRERLGRGDADLRAGVRVDGAVGLARRHAADDVADGDAAGAAALGLAQRGERVGGLPDCVMTTASVFFATIGLR